MWASFPLPGMEGAGQIYCGDWQVPSGNHHNPVVTLTPVGVRVAEVLRLVE